MKRLSKLQRALISAIVIIVAVGWISISLWDSKDQIIDAVTSLALSSLLLSVVPAMFSAFIPAYIYALVLARTVSVPPPTAHVMHAFIVSQVIRHLPGKIWGVFYQAAAMTKWVDARYTVQANIEHYALLNCNSIAIALSVFAFVRYGEPVALGIYLSTLLLLYVALRTAFSNRVLTVIMKVAAFGKAPFSRSVTQNNSLLIIGLLQADWFFYLLTCFIILPIGYSVSDALIVGACYAIAWFVGATTIILPGGLFVREASFLWVVGLFGLDPVEMFIFSIVARALFTLVDVLCTVLTVSFVRDT